MFNGIWLVAAEPLTIQGRDIKVGERFHISRVHSGALLVTGKATIAHPQPPPKAKAPEPQVAAAPPTRRRTRQRKVLEPEAPAQPVQVEPGAPTVAEQPEPITFDGPDVVRERDDDETGNVQGRTYHRRDLEAE
jgi:hypothetical protein